MYMRLFLLLGAALLFYTACTPKATTKSGEAEKPVPEKSYYFQGFVIRDDVQLRQAPSDGAPSIASLDDGSAVNVIRNKNGWYEVLTVNNRQGWVRSDLIGPEELSFGRRASTFSDSILQEYNSTMYIDENRPYEVIYLVLPEDYYQSKGMARRYAQKIGEHYQNHVYPGEVEIRILEADGKELFTRAIMQKKESAGYRAPFLRFGRLHDISLNNVSELEMTVLIPPTVTDEILLAMAREISQGYDLSISKIEIYFVNENEAGMAFLERGTTTGEGDVPCRLYYLEDAAGEDFRFDYCSAL